MPPIAGAVLAYLVGSIPAAYIAGKALRGIDLRQHGSGNLGATNVYRVLGPRVAVLVLLADVLKGALPVVLLRHWTAGAPELVERWAIAYGVAAIAGHVAPIYLLWRGGGKGVATAAGVFLALAPWSVLGALVVWIAVFWPSGYVSLASLAAAVALPVGILVQRGLSSPVLPVAVLVAAFVFWTHRANIGRLRRGEEHRFGRKRGRSHARGQGEGAG